MPLAPGARLGPYEILAPLGAGGMGEVYKARDTRLERTVAVKLIQAHVAADPEFRERFDREARAIAALDHPHICTLYDLGRDTPSTGSEQTPSTSAGPAIDYLVMQFLEGETLADRLARTGLPASDPSRPRSGPDTTLSTVSRGPIPIETTLRYAAEIAHALDAAHRRGIVHRDLKPGNVMLTKAGTKLLDFGLARLATSQDVIEGDQPATRTSPLTGQGAIVGTLNYMSPEQLEGRAVDPRSDIFAFGAMLYEMLTGRRAFEGDSQAGTIAAILGAAPPPLGPLADVKTTLPVVAERALDRLLRKCLAKDPDDRWQSAADLADELLWINEERLRGVTEPAVVAASTAAATSAPRLRGWMALAATAVVVLMGFGAWWYPRPAAPAEPIAFTVDDPSGDGLSNGPGLLAVSPDGRRLAFMTGDRDSSQLWVRSFDSAEARRIDRTTGAWQPFWSPDSRYVAYAGFSGVNPLRRADIAGGAPLTLADGALGRGAWGTSGVVLFTGADGRLYRVLAAGGVATVAVDLDDARLEESLTWPTFLPDGRRFLFLGRGSDPSTSALYLGSLDSPERTHVVNVLSNADYALGHLFYQREGTLMAHPFDDASGRLNGDAFPVIEGIRYNAGNGRGAFSVSATGHLAYRQASSADPAPRTLSWFDRTGASTGQVGAPGNYVSAKLSPDGRQLVVEEVRQEPRASTLWLVDVARGVPTRLTTGSADEWSPVWSPDGSSIVFASVRDGAFGIYRRPAGGAATTDDLLFEGPGRPHGYSPDGRILLFTLGSFPQWRIWGLRLEDSAGSESQAFELFPGSTTNDSQATFSPDGRWIAYQAAEGSSRDAEVYVQPFPADGRRIRISPAGGNLPRWTADGRRLVYRTNSGSLESVSLTPVNGTLQPDPPQTLFTHRRAALNNWWFDMDGKAERFLLIAPPEQADEEQPLPITVILNWAQSLGRRLATQGF